MASTSKHLANQTLDDIEAVLTSDLVTHPHVLTLSDRYLQHAEAVTLDEQLHSYIEMEEELPSFPKYFSLQMIEETISQEQLKLASIRRQKIF